MTKVAKLTATATENRSRLAMRVNATMVCERCYMSVA